MSYDVKHWDEVFKVGPNVKIELIDVEFRVPKGFADPDIPCPLCEANIPKRPARVTDEQWAGIGKYIAALNDHIEANPDADHDALPRKRKGIRMKCEECSGTGHEDHETPCQDCAGTGDGDHGPFTLSTLEGDIDRRREEWAARDTARNGDIDD